MSSPVNREGNQTITMVKLDLPQCLSDKPGLGYKHGFSDRKIVSCQIGVHKADIGFDCKGFVGTALQEGIFRSLHNDFRILSYLAQGMRGQPYIVLDHCQHSKPLIFKIDVPQGLVDDSRTFGWNENSQKPVNTVVFGKLRFLA